MLALQKTAAAPGIELREVPEPGAPQGDEVLIEIAATGVCGTDLHIDHWTTGYENMAPVMPVTIGHEFSGRVLALGPQTRGLEKGDRVTLLPSVTCGGCGACSSGNFDACDTRTGIGVTRAGAFARYTRAPDRNCVKVPDAVSDELAALSEPLSVGAQAVLATAQVKPGQRVLVLGPGTIGQTLAIWSRRSGASVTIAGRDDAHRFQVMQALGFDDLHDVGSRSMTEVFAGKTFDIAFEATGSPQVVNQTLPLLAKGGIFVCVGIHATPAQIDLITVVRRSLQIRGTYRATRAIWDEVMKLLAQEGERIQPMITHRVPLARALEGFDLAHRRVASKVMVLP